ncbi:zinc transport system substrate-binding protein [Ruminococcaceae bacterium YRB3002]|nr:zinc transport system substrate-binding protein [Ruminococcaceae bacterium YRB3002]
MKKIISSIIIMTMLTGCLASCSAGGKDPDDGRLSIVATIFPEYDWVMNILGDKSAGADVSLLMDSGTDLHSFQPSAKDIMKILDSDLFIYVGGESDEWVEDLLAQAPEDLRSINLMEVLGDRAREEEELPGMEEHEHDHDDVEYDEHIWMSLKNASVCCDAIADAVKELDKENAPVYDQNLASYKDRLQDLDDRYGEVCSASGVKTILVADRFPFIYMVRDYGLDYYAAFAGCSAESEASFETVIMLAGKIDELGLKNVIRTESGDDRLPDSIISNTKAGPSGVGILTLNSMQSVTANDIENGATYLGFMEQDLEVLRQALS